MSSLVAELLPFAALGLFGSLHCAGMCGGFAVAVTTAGSRASRAAARRQAGYVLGKASTYATLGLALSSGVGSLAHSRAANVAAWAAGGVLVALGLGWLGLIPRGRMPRLPLLPEHVLARARGGLRAVHAELVRLPGFTGAFGAGAVNGLVPCGLSWAAIALAATASPAAALLGPFLFGLATAPALAVVGAGAWLLRRAHLRRAAPILIGLALVASGLLTGLRGAHGLRAAPSCCEREPASLPVSSALAEASGPSSPNDGD
jgi:hypothetical protein